ncbi:MAG: TrkH family potassium uptake protein [Spirochaetaceae bacterium]|nr:TrkH family potassium uptake protein [Spirochaetaceae bacterium]MDT8296996.1 TrkH family potassium uptake protein [Spirochaetaceae bacterium]
MMSKLTVRWNVLFIFTLFLSIVSLYVEQMELSGLSPFLFTNLIDLVILIILVAETVLGFRDAPYKRIFFRRNVFSIGFSAIFIILFAYNKYITLGAFLTGTTGAGFTILLIRNFFLVLKVFSRYRRITGFIEGLNMHPALTIILSFLFVILAGTWLLMMPFTARAGGGLSFVDALFTATSAVCVTGLIVVDTATYFSVGGQLVILTLIQVGGLGIMVLSYFTLFILGRRISVEQKSLVAYMLSEDDMGKLKSTLKSIIGITVLIEGIGALILTTAMNPEGSSWGSRVLFGAFHAVSAFCNAGFALLSDSLETFSGRPVVLVTFALLIISGGLSFGVFINIRNVLMKRFRRHNAVSRNNHAVITLNTRIVLSTSGILLLSGMLMFYILEHRGVLAPLPLGRQYLAAFFQSVTLRTAGFNSVPFGSLSTGVIIAMVVFMFIGGASGSTAGGIKVNTMAVLLASVKSAWRNDARVVLRSHTVDEQSVNRAYLIFLFGVISVMFGGFVLSVTESAPFKDILFETVSAFGTVGLSTGLTGSLSSIGKTVIIVLMFIGRLGPLTVLAASSPGQGRLQITYPRAEIAIG